MKIVRCIHPADTWLGEITFNTRYLVLKTWELHETDFQYVHYSIIMNSGIKYDFFDNRFEKEKDL